MENQTAQSEKPIHSVVFDRQMRIEGWNQDALSQQVVLCLGVGGLGSCVAINLVRLGVKKVILVDYDKVDTHNLNRQVLFSKEDVGKSKVEQAMKNLEMHNVGGTIVEGYDIDAIRCWNKIVKLAEECTAVFNMIDWGENFDVAVQSLCLNLKIPFIMGGTFAASLSVDSFSGNGKPCFLCVTDGIKKEIIEKLMPEKIKGYENIDFIPKDNNPVGQSNVFLCSTCSNFMTSMFINHVFKDPSIEAPKRVLFYVNSFESVTFPAEINPNCPFCKSFEEEKEEQEAKEEKGEKEGNEEKGEKEGNEEKGEKEAKEEKEERM